MTRRRRTSLPRRCWHALGMLAATGLFLLAAYGFGELLTAVGR